MTFRDFLERDAGVFETKEGCHVASNVLLLTGTNCSFSSQPFQKFPSSTFWRKLVSRQEEFYAPLQLSKLVFVENKRRRSSSPQVSMQWIKLSRSGRSRPPCTSKFVDNSQPDGHLQFDHDPKFQSQTQLQDRFVSKVATWNSQFKWIRPAWQPYTKLSYQYHYGCMCDVTAL